MPDIDIKKLDLNLLSIFSLLMREQSVSGAARHLAIGQPAVSHALARLRNMLGDPLLVRSGKGMEPTPFAVSLLREIKPALVQIEGALRGSVSFNPASDNRDFRIAMSDDIQISCLPEISRLLSEQLPGARLIVQNGDYRQAGEILDGDQASVVVAYLDRLPANAKVRKIRRVGYRAAMAGNNTPKLSIADYCRRHHVLVTFAGDLTGYIDETLLEKGVTRSIALSVPNFSVLPFLMQGTELVATVPVHVASTFLEKDDMNAMSLPFASPEFDISMAWRAATDKDPAERLLRQIIVEVVHEKTSASGL